MSEDQITIHERTIYSGSRDHDTDWYTALIMRPHDGMIKTSRIFKGLADTTGNEQVITSAPINCFFNKIN